MTTTLTNGSVDTEPYVVGLLLTTIILSAVPTLATGVTWFAAILCLVVWTSVYATNQQGAI